MLTQLNRVLCVLLKQGKKTKLASYFSCVSSIYVNFINQHTGNLPELHFFIQWVMGKNVPLLGVGGGLGCTISGKNKLMMHLILQKEDVRSSNSRRLQHCFCHALTAKTRTHFELCCKSEAILFQFVQQLTETGGGFLLWIIYSSVELQELTRDTIL